LTVTEIKVGAPADLRFHRERIGVVEAVSRGRSTLNVRFESGSELQLAQCVDLSQQLEAPRVFVIEGTPPDRFLIFGGEKMYWLTPEGLILEEFRLLREQRHEEYWQTQIVGCSDGILAIYEGGVVAIDENLQVRWQKKKFFNDVFVGLEDGFLNFVQDDDTLWRMRVSDGAEEPNGVGSTIQ
jgi:hypothetical protein